jgi:hypothetical protein
MTKIVHAAFARPDRSLLRKTSVRTTNRSQNHTTNAKISNIVQNTSSTG